GCRLAGSERKQGVLSTAGLLQLSWRRQLRRHFLETSVDSSAPVWKPAELDSSFNSPLDSFFGENPTRTLKRRVISIQNKLRVIAENDLSSACLRGVMSLSNAALTESLQQFVYGPCACF